MPPPKNDEDEREQTKAISIGEMLEMRAESRKTATLTAIAGRGAGKVYRLDGELMVLGRASDAAVLVDDDGVSRRHAQIALAGATHVLSDLGSRNGTLYNGTRIEGPVELRDGDRIRIGATSVFKFGYQDEIEERMQAQLYDSATRDALTQAFNRRYFTERLATEWAWSKRHEQPCAVIAVDADHFKRINDGFGHAGGDYVLKQLVVSMQRVVRREDLVARIGGEEFVVLARATPRGQACVLAERIRVAVEAFEFVYNGARLPVTVSLGVGTSDDLGVESADEMMGRADEFLYRAKEGGRNRVEPPPRGV